jgi:hypothetical protein
MKKIFIKALCFTMPLILLTACFNLEEEAFSEVVEKDFVATEQDVASLLASTYSPLTYIFNWQGYFDLQEEAGDCIITPTRPNGWDDGGVYRRMHQHEWDAELWQPINTYQTCYSGINSSNRILDQVKEDRLPIGELKEPTMAELRAIRAFWYAILLDTHGNVPIVTAFTDEIPTQSTRQQLYDFIIDELTEVMPNLSDEANAATYGRINKWAAYMVLARVYLNAGIYTGTPQWAKALDCADKIIESGIYALSADYSDNFKIALNHSNKEVIFAVPYDRVYAGFQQFAKWYPPISRIAFGSSYQCWGGSAANPQFINAYQDGDQRLEKTWLTGPQYSKADPTQLVWTCQNYIPSLTCYKNGENFTSIDYGYRVWKYEYNYTTSWNWENDFAYFRYAETMMIKAECLLRLGQNENEAASIVSQIRARVFDDADKAGVTVADLKANTKIKYGTLDWDNNIEEQGDQTPIELGGLYDEYGWEFACEAQRRTHMIRFGAYDTKNWFNHTAIKDGHTRIFPIPYEEIIKNNNLKQNPGY